MKTTRTFVILSVALFHLSIGAACVSAQKVSVEQTPKPVINAFRKKFPGFKINAVKKEVAADKPAFEIESTKDGLAVDALLRPDGTFITIERQIKESELPAAVAAAAKAKYKGATWEKVEELDTDGKVTFEIAMKKADGVAAVAIFDKNGKLIEEE